jgi:cytochrome b6-f complex iron-sulfur subunit
MATIAELSGDEREQRAAELKRKMQEAAQRRQAASGEGATTAAAPSPAPAAPPASTTATADAVIVPAEELAAAVSDGGDAALGDISGNGVAAAPPVDALIGAPPATTAPATAPAPFVELSPEETARREMNRREFLMYSWGAALGLLTLQGGVASFLFLYPRFRAGEFGGDFFKLLSDFGNPSAEPKGETTGKFWMVTTQEGEPKAIYMVCTHLGCLYKWVGANNRFECPCHGSKFSHDGFYIEGPAPRSLDYFDVTIEGEQVTIHTGRKNTGIPSAESPARAMPV